MWWATQTFRVAHIPQADSNILQLTSLWDFPVNISETAIMSLGRLDPATGQSFFEISATPLTFGRDFGTLACATLETSKDKQGMSFSKKHARSFGRLFVCLSTTAFRASYVPPHPPMAILRCVFCFLLAECDLRDQSSPSLCYVTLRKTSTDQLRS